MPVQEQHPDVLPDILGPAIWGDDAIDEQGVVGVEDLAQAVEEVGVVAARDGDRGLIDPYPTHTQTGERGCGEEGRGN